MKYASPGGFSMVEVVLALGVVTFAVLMLVALIPFGLQTNRNSRDEGAAANIVRAITADWRSIGQTTNLSPLFGLPPLSPTMATNSVIGIGENGRVTNAPEARYRVAYAITPPASASSFLPYYVSFTVTWPGTATTALGKFESVASISSR